jgi:hypothetical protein
VYKVGDTISIKVNDVNADSGWIPLTECRLTKSDGTGIEFDHWGTGNVEFQYEIQSTDPEGEWCINYCTLSSDFEPNEGWYLKTDHSEHCFMVGTCTNDDDCPDNKWVCSGNNRCGTEEGDTREYRDYYCEVSSGICKYDVTSSEDCRCDATDSDNQDFESKGTCTDYKGCSGRDCRYATYVDYCLDSITLREYYKEYILSGSEDTAYCNYTDKHCTDFGPQYVCSDGKCVAQPLLTRETAKFVVKNLTLILGRSEIVRIKVMNPCILKQDYINLSLEHYEHAKFENGKRSVMIPINPNETIYVYVKLYSSILGSHILGLKAISTFTKSCQPCTGNDCIESSDQLGITIVSPPGFSGLKIWGIVLLIISACVIWIWVNRK